MPAAAAASDDAFSPPLADVGRTHQQARVQGTSQGPPSRMTLPMHTSLGPPVPLPFDFLPPTATTTTSGNNEDVPMATSLHPSVPRPFDFLPSAAAAPTRKRGPGPLSMAPLPPPPPGAPPRDPGTYDAFAQAIANRFSDPASQPLLTARLSPNVFSPRPQGAAVRFQTLPPGDTSPFVPSLTAAAAVTASAASQPTPDTTVIPSGATVPSLVIRRPPRNPRAGAPDTTFPDTAPSALHPLLSSPDSILILDIRPHAAYCSARLTHAISLSVPSTLIKRPAFTLSKLATMIPHNASRRLFERWRDRDRVLVYDADSYVLQEGNNVLGLLRKFVGEGFKGEVTWLKGGMQALWREKQYHAFIDTQHPPEDDEDAMMDVSEDGPENAALPRPSLLPNPASSFLRARDLPMSAFQTSSTTSQSNRDAPLFRTRSSPGTYLPLHLPRHTIASNTTLGPGGGGGGGTHAHAPPKSSTALAVANPFYDNIRQNLELAHGITQRIPLLLPPSVHVRWAVARIPREWEWLRRIEMHAGKDEGTEALAMQFYKIELGEQRRMMTVMEHHSREGDAGVGGGGGSGGVGATTGFQHTMATGMAGGSTNGSGLGEGYHSGEGSGSGADTWVAGSGDDGDGGSRVGLGVGSGGMGVPAPGTAGTTGAGAGGAGAGAEMGESQRKKRKRKKTFPYSITAGVEKGDKNRYRNIWPFEHARVRLNTGIPSSTLSAAAPAATAPASYSLAHATASDDYVNASHVQPLGTNRRYIATQGPMESTYADFWTLVWEQNVHVIVMLTQQIENSTVKCGRYWEDGEYGAFSLRLVEQVGSPDPEDTKDQSGPAGGANGDAGVGGGKAAKGSDSGGFDFGFFPVPKSDADAASKAIRNASPHNSTIRRTFELRKKDPHSDVGVIRRVTHLQYLAWPDMDVPQDPAGVLGLVREVERVVSSSAVVAAARAQSASPPPPDTNPYFPLAPSHSNVNDSANSNHYAAAPTADGSGRIPVLLHCSAGVGRTGGFMMIDAVLDGLRRELRAARARGEDVGEGLSGLGAGVGRRTAVDEEMRAVVKEVVDGPVEMEVDGDEASPGTDSGSGSGSGQGKARKDVSVKSGGTGAESSTGNLASVSASASESRASPGSASPPAARDSPGAENSDGLVSRSSSGGPIVVSGLKSGAGLGGGGEPSAQDTNAKDGSVGRSTASSKLQAPILAWSQHANEAGAGSPPRQSTGTPVLDSEGGGSGSHSRSVSGNGSVEGFDRPDVDPMDVDQMDSAFAKVEERGRVRAQAAQQRRDWEWDMEREDAADAGALEKQREREKWLKPLSPHTRAVGGARGKSNNINHAGGASSDSDDAEPARKSLLASPSPSSKPGSPARSASSLGMGPSMAALLSLTEPPSGAESGVGSNSVSGKFAAPHAPRFALRAGESVDPFAAAAVTSGLGPSPIPRDAALARSSGKGPSPMDGAAKTNSTGTATATVAQPNPEKRNFDDNMAKKKNTSTSASVRSSSDSASSTVPFVTDSQPEYSTPPSSVLPWSPSSVSKLGTSVRPHIGAGDTPSPKNDEPSPPAIVKLGSGRETGSSPSSSDVDYKHPRDINANNSPPMLSTYDEPIRQVLEDMREQRMSLCQSLRQYVFVHRAIIEGALEILSEEDGAAGGNGDDDDDEGSPVGDMVAHKRRASPTELVKESKKGEVMLAKRPSLRRKADSLDDSPP